MITEQRGNATEPIIAGVSPRWSGSRRRSPSWSPGFAQWVPTPPRLLALTVTFGIGTAVLCIVYRRPITLAWSTPGAAMLASMGASYHAGWSAAVGAFLVVGLLIVATGLIPALGELIGAIPTPIAQAMLAGVLLTLCLAPMTSLAAQPLLTVPILLVWLAATRWVPRWALPIALATALAVIGIHLVSRVGNSLTIPTPRRRLAALASSQVQPVAASSAALRCIHLDRRTRANEFPTRDTSVLSH